MRKALAITLALALCLAFGSMQAYACGGEKTSSVKSAAADKETEAQLASSSTTSEKSCSATKAKMIGSKQSCSAEKTSQAAMVSGEKSCAAMKGASAKAFCSPEQCAEWKQMCEKYGEGAEIRFMSIKGMTCGGCESSVKAGLMKIDGVHEVAEVSHKSEVAVVIVDASKIQEESLTKTVVNKGYQAEIMPAVAHVSDNPSATSASSKAGCNMPCPSKTSGAKVETASSPQ